MAKAPPSSRDRAGIAIGRRLQEVGLTQADLVRILNKSQAWVSQVLLDKADRTLRRLYINDPAFLVRLIEVLQWTVEQFVEETGVDFVMQVTQPSQQSHPREGVIPADVIRIPFRGVAAAGNAPDADATIEIPRKFARPRCAMYVVEGESMLPNFEEGDTLLVDESLTIPRNNGVFAIRIPGNGVQIRRCWMLKSLDRTVFNPDNQDGQFPSYDWQDDDIEIMGQVYSKLSAAPV